MRFLPIVALALLAAACARTPQPAPTTPAGPIPIHRGSSDLIGLTVAELGARFGQPSFQVREGVGHKMQWANAYCVLDAYLYPPVGGRGVERVAHVDVRRPSGDRFDIPACIASLAR